MSQKDIIDYLEKNRDRWFTYKELSKETGKSNTAICRCINRSFRYVEKRYTRRSVKKNFIYRQVLVKYKDWSEDG